jgi:hypothetical protein
MFIAAKICDINLLFIHRVFSNLEQKEGCKVDTSTVYDLYTKEARIASITPLSQSSFGKIVHNTFSGVKNRSLYIRNLPQRKNVYVGITIKFNDKENAIQYLTTDGIQETATKNSFTLIDVTKLDQSLVSFTGDLVNGHRVTKDVTMHKITKVVTVIVAGKIVKTDSIPTVCNDVSTLDRILKLVKLMNISKGFHFSEDYGKNVPVEEWNNGGKRVRALTCSGVINKQSRSNMCLACRKKQSYLQELSLPKKEAKPHNEHSYSNTPIITKEPSPNPTDPANSETNEQPNSSVIEFMDVNDENTHHEIVTDCEEDDPTYSPSDEDSEMLNTSSTCDQDLDETVHKIIGSLCPSLEREEFVDLLKSQVGNTNLLDARLRRWSPRF